jgi:kynurenine formamidase
MGKPTGVVDLTRPLWVGMPVHPDDAPVAAIPRCTFEREGYAVTTLVLSSHAGTHMDAPYHFIQQGATIDALPVTRLVGDGVVLDLRGRGPAISLAELDAAIEGAGGAEAGDFVLLWTGWDAHFGQDDMWDHPYLSADAAKRLLVLGITMLATDCGGVDSRGDEAVSEEEAGHPIHYLLLAGDILIVENLTGLEQLGAGRCRCAFLPLPIVGGDGSPIRAVAWRE